MHLDAFRPDRAEHRISEAAVRIMIFDGEDAALAWPWHCPATSCGRWGRYYRDRRSARRRRQRGAGCSVPFGPYRTGCQRAGTCRDHIAGGGQSVSDRAAPFTVSQPVYSADDQTGHHFHPSCTNLADILCVQGKRVVAKSHTINDHRQGLQIPRSPHLFYDYEGQGASARISRLNLSWVAWALVSDALPRGWPIDRDRTSSTSLQWPDPRIGRLADRPS